MMMQDNAANNCGTYISGLSQLMPLNHPTNVLHFADLWQHFAGTVMAEMLIVSVGNLVPLQVPKTLCYFHSTLG